MSGRPPDSPPRLPGWLLEKILPGEATREGLLGDLHEEFLDRRSVAPRSARIWYWGQAIGILLHWFSWRALRKRSGSGRWIAVSGGDWGLGGLIQGTLQDLRYALRNCRRDPSFALIAMSIPALAIAANSAVFSVMDATLIRPLPYPRSDRIVMVSNLDRDGFRESVAPGNFVDWSEREEGLASVSAFHNFFFNLTGQGEPQRLTGLKATAGLFPALGLTPVLGRSFTALEDAPGESPVVVLSFDLWQSLFQGRPEVLGQSLELNGRSHQVIGVLPAAWRFPNRETDLVVPLALSAEERSDRSSYFLSVVGRMREGTSLGQLNASLTTLTEQLQHEYREPIRQLGVLAEPLQKVLAGSFQEMVTLFQGAVGLLLLAACGNLGCLLLARGSARSRELATRAAIGASQARIMRQLLTESLLLGLGAGVGGLLVGHWLLAILLARIPQDLSWAHEISLNFRVLLFGLLLALASGLLFGLVPALQARRTDLARAVSHTARGGGANRRLIRIFVAAQVAFAVILLTAGILFTRSFSFLQGLDPGFDAHGLLTLRVDLPEARYPDSSARSQFYGQVLEGVRTLTGVEQTGFTAGLPFTLDGGSTGLTMENREAPEGTSPYAVCRGVSDGYFEAMRIGLISGRFFEGRDMGPSAAPTVILNRSLARRYFGDEDPVGQRFKLYGRNSATPWARIVGVVQDVRRFSLQVESPAAFYLPYGQSPIAHFDPRDLVIRTTQAPSSLTPAVREKIREVDPDLPVYQVRTMQEVVAQSMALPRFNMALFGLLGLVMVWLAGSGIYGIVSYETGRRTAEIGIRMALGAGRSRVLSMVLAEGGRLGLAGAVLGVGTSLLLSRLLAGWIYGIRSDDPLSFLLVAAASFLLVLLASLHPALRATKVDPYRALQEQ